MPPSESPAEKIERLLAAGAFGQALLLSSTLVAASKRSLLGWRGRARANLGLGRVCDADSDLDSAIRVAPDDPQSNLLRGMVDQRLGRIDAAIERLRKVASTQSPCTLEASVALAETYYFAHRRDELKKLVEANGAWMSDPRGPLMAARVRARDDLSGAIDDVLAISRNAPDIVLRRVAGFDAVNWLDKAGRYREAFDFASQLHAATTAPFDIDGMLVQVSEQRALLAKGGCWFTPRADPVQGVSMVFGLPRSGTTLLEQMLDGHPNISGIGEYDGVEALGANMTSTGCSLRNIGQLPNEVVMRFQKQYLDGAARLNPSKAQWTFDKNLKAWRFLPQLAAVMPGTVGVHIARDPRDMAISIFLSFFNPIADGWTGKLNSVRRVIEAERSILPEALTAFGFPHECIVYEDLVADPSGHVRRCLDLLGLPMNDAVLRPESNPRAVFTLSHEQVRNPIHAASIGRWRNYEWAFDGSWDRVASDHDAKRIHLVSNP
ncbi:MAG: sulfotransferase [Planctomycetota bacterium]|nr:sulfotransferase [Planctomycetota bacterium]